ncbi:MAG: hypothetical protein FD130_1529, partial [Halothiobacillaceae bacterium]
SPNSALTLLFTSVIGSAINLPLYRTRSERPLPEQIPLAFRGLLRQSQPPFTGMTVVAINVGGALVPLFFSFYLFQNSDIDLFTTLSATLVMTVLCYGVSRPIPGLGIAMPIFIAPIAAALISVIIDPAHSAPLAYISGTLGVLIGADLLRLNQIKKIGAPMASIGGAGTFDGIFITGIVAVLLA